jgi:hypothetical protein
MDKMPRFTARLNRSKKNVVEGLSKLSDELEKMDSMFSGVVEPIKRL